LRQRLTTLNREVPRKQTQHPGGHVHLSSMTSFEDISDLNLSSLRVLPMWLWAHRRSARASGLPLPEKERPNTQNA
jgi:hypothetical protein